MSYFPWGKIFGWILVGLIFVGLLFYGVWFLWFYSNGASFWSSLFWFKGSNLNFRFLFYFNLVPLALSYVIGVGVVLVFCFREVDKVSKFENLSEMVEEVEGRLNSLRKKEGKLQEKIRILEGREKGLSKSVEGLEKRKALLEEELRKLEKEVKKLDELVERAVEEGRERGYRSVITELRSLRFQKSALVDLFSKNRELQDAFRKVTGKKLIQFLNEVKRRVKESKNESL